MQTPSIAAKSSCCGQQREGSTSTRIGGAPALWPCRAGGGGGHGSRRDLGRGEQAQAAKEKKKERRGSRAPDDSREDKGMLKGKMVRSDCWNKEKLRNE